MSAIQIRQANSGDAEAMHAMICELADYEKALDQVELTAERLRNDGFGDTSYFQALVAQVGDEVIGMALYYPRYSTWKGLTLYLEDLIVKEPFRRRGIGAQLLEKLLLIAEEKGVHRLEWQVLDWNEPAIEFYKKYKVVFEEEWLNCKIVREEIQRFAQEK